MCFLISFENRIFSHFEGSVYILYTVKIAFFDSKASIFDFYTFDEYLYPKLFKIENKAVSEAYFMDGSLFFSCVNIKIRNHPILTV